MRSLPLLVTMLLLAGCFSQPQIEPAPAPEATLFGATSMRIHPIFSQIKDWSGDTKPDGIEVLLEFSDQFGDPTKAAGTVMFELYDYREAQPDPKGRRLANPWVGSVATLSEQRARWNRTSRTYTFQLALPQIKTTQSYVLTAQFRSSTGGRFFDRVVLAGEEEPKVGTTQPSTQPATQPSLFFDPGKP